MNELFLICPFSHSEGIIREYINPSAYFLTSSASVFRLNNDDYVDSIIDAVTVNGIEKIYVTASTDCQFAQRVIRAQSASDFYAERALFEVYRANKKEIDHLKTNEEQVVRLLDLHLDIQQAQLIDLLARKGVQREVVKLILSPKQLINREHQLRLAEKVGYEH
jgi:hypothetical protein